MGAPAEGNLHLASVWPMGLRLGFVSLYQLVAGTFVGMKLLTLIFVLTLTVFILNRGTCICETVTAPVTLTNNWIKVMVFHFKNLKMAYNSYLEGLASKAYSDAAATELATVPPYGTDREVCTLSYL